MPVPTPTTRRRLSRDNRLGLTNARGQGVVEYILLIVVVVALALAVSAQLFKPFNDWAKNYIGDYIYCLLDQGELPALGGANAISECDKNFDKFTFGNGIAAKSGGSESEGDSEKGDRSRLNQKGSGSNSADNGGAGNSGRGRSRRSQGLGSGFDGANSSRAGKTTDVSDTVGANRRVSIRVGARSSVLSDPKAIRAMGLSGMIAQEQERIKKREEKVRSVARSSERSVAFVRGKTKMMAVEPRTRKATDLDLTAGDWSLGGTLRFLFILAIILALVLFVGGQVMQISKSMEKE